MKILKNVFYKKIYQSLIKIIILYFLLPHMAIATPAYLAIVIDDIGYRPHQDNAIYQLSNKISVAIIPSAPYASQRNKEAYHQGRDILIHLPMETIHKNKLDDGALTLGMNQQQVNQTISDSLIKVPHAIGLNNHMGSAATANIELMQKLMFTLKQHNLSFLDSRTNANSVASKVAKNMGIKTLSRHIFLDNENTFSAVQTQFKKAIQRAQKYGVAIVIGHPRKNTIAVLQQELKYLPKNIQLINIGALWKLTKTKATTKPFNILFQNKNIDSYSLS